MADANECLNCRLGIWRVARLPRALTGEHLVQFGAM
jgi:hypothetical protein